MPSQLSFVRVEQIGDVCVAHVLRKRILDEPTIFKIGEDLFSLIDVYGHRSILLNMFEVEYMSSAMLGKFITLQKKLQARGGKLVMCCLDEDIWEPLRVTRVDQIWKIIETQAQGLNQFAS